MAHAMGYCLTPPTGLCNMDNLPPILPLGTAVVVKVQIQGTGQSPVCPAGAVGTIVRSPADPQHGYRVRLPGGQEVTLGRHELAVLKHFQRQGMAPPAAADAMAGYDLHQYVIYRCVVGSRAYGLDQADSDVDRRGVYLPPAEIVVALRGARAARGAALSQPRRRPANEPNGGQGAVHLARSEELPGRARGGAAVGGVG
jgi:hypothetical protein